MKWKQIKHADYAWQQTIVTSVAANELSNHCNLLLYLTVLLSVLDKICTITLADKIILESKLYEWLQRTANAAHSSYQIILLHNSIYGLHVHSKLCGSH